MKFALARISSIDHLVPVRWSSRFFANAEVEYKHTSHHPFVSDVYFNLLQAVKNVLLPQTLKPTRMGPALVLNYAFDTR